MLVLFSFLTHIETPVYTCLHLMCTQFVAIKITRTATSKLYKDL